MPFDLSAAFANVSDGGVIDIPPGTYTVNDTLSLKNKRDVTIYAHQAKIYSAMRSSGKPKLDMAGAANCQIHGWQSYSHPNANIPIAEIVLGRTAQAAGGNNSFYDCSVGGNYSAAGVYSCCSEGNRFVNCGFSTETDKPALINAGKDILGLGLVESSNCLMWLTGCHFRNYGTAPYLVLLHDSVSGTTIRDSYFFVGTNGVGVRVQGINNHTLYFNLSDVRVEGNGDDCLLLDNDGLYAACWNIERVAYAVQSQYIIRSNKAITDSRFDFTFCSWAYSQKFIHLTDGAWLDRVELIRVPDDKISRSAKVG